MVTKNITEIIKTRVEEIWEDEDDIVHVRALPNVHGTLADAINLIEIGEKLAMNGERNFLFDIANVTGVDREALKYYASEKAQKVVSRVAILTNSPFSKMFGNLFIGIYKPPFPTRLFKDKTKAKNWLIAIE